MRNALFLLLLLPTFSAYSQRITGTVTDGAGNSVEYVNIGVENSQTGLISDENGRFSLTVPDSLAHGNLYVSHITYETQSIPIRELLARATDGQPLTIRLTERAFAVPEIVVRPGRVRYRRVSTTRTPAPISAYWDSAYTEAEFRRTGVRPPEDQTELQREAGSVLEIKEPLLIEKVYFQINSAADSLLTRVNIYAVAPGPEFVPLHSRPFYVMVEPTSKPEEYQVDVSEGMIVAPVGEIVVALEQVRVYGDMLSVGIPAYFGASYFRSAGRTYYKTDAVHIGLSVYGRVIR